MEFKVVKINEAIKNAAYKKNGIPSNKDLIYLLPRKLNVQECHLKADSDFQHVFPISF